MIHPQTNDEEHKQNTLLETPREKNTHNECDEIARCYVTLTIKSVNAQSAKCAAKLKVQIQIKIPKLSVGNFESNGNMQVACTEFRILDFLFSFLV